VKRRRWTASSLAKQYRDCLDAGDRACARDAAERIQRSSSPTAQKVVRSARAHGLLGLRGGRPKRGLRGTPAQHETTAREYLGTAQRLYDEGRVANARDYILAAQAECAWIRGTPVCENVRALRDAIATEAVPRGVGTTKKARKRR